SRERYASEVLPQLATGAAFELEVALQGAHGPVPAVLSASRHAAAENAPPMDLVILSKSPQRPASDHGMEAPPHTYRDNHPATGRADARDTRHGSNLYQKDRELLQQLLESRKNEALLRTVLDTVDVGVAVLDAHGLTVLENARSQSQFRHATPEGTDSPKDADLLLYRPDRTTPVPAMDRAVPRLVKGESFTDELVWIGPRHDQRALSVSGRSVQGPDFKGSVLAFSDVTRLVEALAAKEKFIANISHELRTPLTSIMGYLELALDDPSVPARVVAHLSVAMRNSKRLLQIVTDLLATAAGPESIEPETVDLADIIADRIQAAAPRSASHHVQITRECPDNLTAHADPFRIGQVLDNLLSNAIKFSPHGGKVTVRASHGPAGTTMQVADTGVGMDAEVQRGAFTAFFRSNSALKATIPGAGLGLGIARNIVEAHQGTITVQSTPGTGSVFTVTLPNKDPTDQP
ncbi:sensor histidine kinase, partial [Arthrobacter sp. KK5.5]|uniref:sensor histidine kinase n=1 Tax=Arthrobacter sp. KK5.5 TaxID=3373084 RepID=UPI003EE65CA7